MKETEIVARIKQQFAGMAVEWVEPENGDAYAFVPGDKIEEISRFLKTTPELAFDYLMNISAFDAREHIEVTYHYYSYVHRHSVILKVKAARTGGKVRTLSYVYGTAGFQEREVFDHFGVRFDGHPDLRRILLPDDWVGYPLLKDYKEEEEYNGIATTRPSLL